MQMNEYWHVKRENDILTTDIYSSEYRLTQRTVEHIRKDGVEIDSMLFYQLDTLGNTYIVNANIEYNDIFPFEPKDNSYVYLSSFNWENGSNTRPVSSTSPSIK